MNNNGRISCNNKTCINNYPYDVNSSECYYCRTSHNRLVNCKDCNAPVWLRWKTNEPLCKACIRIRKMFGKTRNELKKRYKEVMLTS